MGERGALGILEGLREQCCFVEVVLLMPKVGLQGTAFETG